MILGFGGVVLVLAGAWGVDQALGRDVLLLSPDSDFAVELNQEDYADGVWDGTIPEIYGNVSDVPVRVISPDPERILRPKEDPSITLLIKGADYNPFQAQTLWLFARFAMIGLGALGVLSLFFPKAPVREESTE
jgi:hypothetical protein